MQASIGIETGMPKHSNKQRDEGAASAGSAGTEKILRGLYERPGFLVRRATQLSTAIFAERCPEITARQYGALHILAHIDNLDQKQLARLLFVDQTNIRIILEGLEKRGFVRRIQSTNDRRRILVEMTESGRLAEDSFEKKAQSAQDQFLKTLTHAERKTLANLLTKLLSA